MDRLQDSFGFCEQTFLLTSERTAVLRPLLEERLRPSEAGKHTLCDLYYDTGSWAFARAGFEDKPYQERLWLRSDEALRRQGRGQVLLRQTLNGRIWHKSAEAELSVLESRLGGGQPPPREAIFWQELFWFLDRNHPAPKALVRYERTEYAEPETLPGVPVLRAILDEELRWQKEDLTVAALGRDPGGAPLLEGDRAVLTLRFEGAVPLWLVCALGGLGAYPARFSKLTACWTRCVRPPENRETPRAGQNQKEDAAC